MDNSYSAHSNTADFASAPWPDPLRDWVIADNLYFPDFNAVDDETFQPAPTTEVGGLYKSINTGRFYKPGKSEAYLNVDIYLLCCATECSLSLAHAGLMYVSFLASFTILRIHRMPVQSPLRWVFRGLPAATSWQRLSDRGRSPCRLLSGRNTRRKCKMPHIEKSFTNLIGFSWA